MPASPRASPAPGRPWCRFAAVTTAVCALAALGAGPAQALDLRGGDESLLDSPLDQTAALTDATTANTSDLTTVTQNTAPVAESLQQTLAPLVDATVQTAAPLAATVEQTGAPLAATVEQTAASVVATTEQVLAPTLDMAQQVVTPVLATVDETLASDATPALPPLQHDNAPAPSQPERATAPSDPADATSAPLSPPAARSAPTLGSTSGELARGRPGSPVRSRSAHREPAETGIARPRLGPDNAWIGRSEDFVTVRASEPERSLPSLPLDGLSGNDDPGSPLAPAMLVLAALLVSFALVPPAARARLVPLAAARLLPADARFRLARPG